MSKARWLLLALLAGLTSQSPCAGSEVNDEGDDYEGDDVLSDMGLGGGEEEEEVRRGPLFLACIEILMIPRLERPTCTPRHTQDDEEELDDYDDDGEELDDLDSLKEFDLEDDEARVAALEAEVKFHYCPCSNSRREG